MDHVAQEALQELGLTSDDLNAYEQIAAGERPRHPWGLGRLRELGLIEEAPHLPAGHIARDPRATARRLIAHEHEALSRTARRLTQLPALEELAGHFDPHRMYSGPGSEFIATGKEMNSRIGEVLAAATTELCTAQPAPPEDRDPSVRQLGRKRGRTAIHQGLTHRALYNSAALTDEATGEYVAVLLDGGGEARVTAARVPRMIVVDHQHLFVDNFLTADQGARDSGWHITDRAAVAWARAVYDMFWWQATRWQDLAPQAGSGTTTEQQRRILRELESGCSQQQVGPRIGVRERTVQKALADLRESLGMPSMYQVMVWWARSPERELP
ncbi:hypothetical protein ACWGH2_16115 [Streptomyces sp. NPDC054871]